MRNIKDLTKIIGSTENEQLEYKAVLPPARSLAQIIAAFANSQGGLIVLGVNDANGEIKITGLSEDFHANGVTHKAIDLLSPKPEVRYEYVIRARSASGICCFERCNPFDQPKLGCTNGTFDPSHSAALKNTWGAVSDT